MKAAIKYAPKNLNEVIFPDAALERRIKGYAIGALEGNVMLYGSNGCAKSTIADLMANAIDSGSGCIEHCDMQTFLKTPDLLDKLKASCQAASFTESGKHILVLNEFDSAVGKPERLWTAMDARPSQLMVIITTNEPMQVHKSIRSRCDMIKMPNIRAVDVLPRAQEILKAEGLVLPSDYVLQCLRTRESANDLRKYMGLLDELLMLHRTGEPMPMLAAANSPDFKLQSVG